MWCDINHKREVAVIGRASMHASDRKRSTGAWMERFFIQWSKCLRRSSDHDRVHAELAPFQAAPGQVVTLFLDNISFGAGGNARSAVAGPGDLPQSLAGISSESRRSTGLS